MQTATTERLGTKRRRRTQAMQMHQKRLHQRAKALYIGGSTRRDRAFNNLVEKRSRLLHAPVRKLVFRFADFPRNPGQTGVGKCRILSHTIKVRRTPLLDRTKLHVQPKQNVVNDRTLRRIDPGTCAKRRDMLERGIAPREITRGITSNGLHVERAYPENVLGRLKRNLRKKLQRVNRTTRMIVGQRKLDQADAH